MATETESQVETKYQYLEPKPYKKWTKQLGIKGRNMLVWHLVAQVRHTSPEEVARDYRLPVEAVHEALAYFEENKDWILAENRAVAEELGMHG